MTFAYFILKTTNFKCVPSVLKTKTHNSKFIGVKINSDDIIKECIHNIVQYECHIHVHVHVHACDI